ncbi:MAG: hypothetical protein ACFB0C_12570 [Leptolyngbyaceae cyanobacterium]
MKRRDLDYGVIALLVGSSIYVFITGLIADTMGLHHFGFHSQVGYANLQNAANLRKKKDR